MSGEKRDPVQLIEAFAGLLEAEWYNGNLSADAYERLNADLTGMVAILRESGEASDAA